MATHARFTRPIFIALLLVVVAAVTDAIAQPAPPQGTPFSYYKLKEVNLPEEKRPPVKYTREQLQLKNVGGDLPTREGEQFQLNLMGTNIESADAAKRFVAQFLQSLRSPLKLDDQIRLNVTKTTGKPDQKFVDEQMRAGHDATAKRLSGKYKSVGKGSTEMLNELDADLQKQAQGTIAIYRFDEYFNGVVIDNTAITVTNRNGANLAAVRGRFVRGRVQVRLEDDDHGGRSVRGLDRRGDRRGAPVAGALLLRRQRERARLLPRPECSHPGDVVRGGRAERRQVHAAEDRSRRVEQ